MPESRPNARSHAHLEERRSAARTRIRGDVTLRLASGSISARAEDVSSAGMLMYAQDDMRVTVEFEQDGERHTKTGRIVRMQRMRDQATGLAIEFDASDPS